MNHPRAVFLGELEKLRRRFEKHTEGFNMDELQWRSTYMEWLAKEWSVK